MNLDLVFSLLYVLFFKLLIQNLLLTLVQCKELLFQFPEDLGIGTTIVIIRGVLKTRRSLWINRTFVVYFELFQPNFSCGFKPERF